MHSCLSIHDPKMEPVVTTSFYIVILITSLVTFIDDYSRKTWIYFLKAKSEVFKRF